MNRYDLVGKHAVITGGAGGIGRALAAAMIASGAQVTLWDASAEGLAAARAALPQAAAQVVDITDEAAVDAAAAVPERIDILVNNAGVLGDVAPIWESDPARFRRVIEVNLVGVSRARSCGGCARRRRGRIAATSSTSLRSRARKAWRSPAPTVPPRRG